MKVSRIFISVPRKYQNPPSWLARVSGFTMSAPVDTPTATSPLQITDSSIVTPQLSSIRDPSSSQRNLSSGLGFRLDRTCVNAKRSSFRGAAWGLRGMADSQSATDGTSTLAMRDLGSFSTSNPSPAKEWGFSGGLDIGFYW
jgi:hypothetical protein